MHRTHRVDTNQAELIRELEQCNFTVANCSMVGNGFPDLVVARNGRNLLVEVKDGNGQLKTGQKKFALEWKGPVIVAHTVIDVLNEFARAFQKTNG
jgi:Holliday junction resolvase